LCCLLSMTSTIFLVPAPASTETSPLSLHDALPICLPRDCVALVEDTSRESANELMNLTDYLDVLIPRGGAGLIQSVVKNARVPVIQTGVGVCHVYVHEGADLDMAARIIHNATTSRPSVCNAAEC